jgi:D-glycero-D-manno-heptose 1,7-bisphosphate phosphatase
LRRAVFLDRDGVVNEPSWDRVDERYESPVHPRDVVLAESAVEGLRTLAGDGYLTIVISNQPAAAKGKASLSDLWAVHERIVELLVVEGVEVDDCRYCFHHPDGVDSDLGRVCECRKPSPGLILAAASEHSVDLAASWMVGDSDTDMLAGEGAGCRTVLVEHVQSRHRRRGVANPRATVRNLAAAAAFIIQSDRATLPHA